MENSDNNIKLKAAVIGNPVEHSLSPVIHNYWLKKYRINGEYNKILVKNEELEEFLLNLDKNGLEGINVTIPYKENVLKFITVKNHDVSKIGASNTIVVNKSGLEGNNTDHYGFIENIKQELKSYDFKGKNITILGAGGASRAIIYGLINQSVNKIILLNRTREKADIMAKDLMSSVGGIIEVKDWEERNFILSDTDMLVNTTSLGMIGQNKLDIDLSTLKKDAVVTDIVFNPLITDLLQQANDKGYITVDGLGMLLHQAAPAFKSFYDRNNKYIDGLPEVTNELRKQVLSKL